MAAQVCADGCGEPVILRGVGIPERAQATCYWISPTGEQPAVPMARPLATSQRLCGLEGEPCFSVDGDAMQAVTSFNGPLSPAGRYDVTCWVDRGGADGRPNGVLDGPDLLGFAPGVVADGDGIVGSQVVVNVEAL